MRLLRFSFVCKCGRVGGSVGSGKAEVTHTADSVDRAEKFRRLALDSSDWYTAKPVGKDVRAQSAFPYESWRHELPKALDMSPLTSGRSTGEARRWKAAGPEANHRSVAATQFLLHVEPPFSGAPHAWQCSLLALGHLFYRVADKLHFVSLGGHSWAALIWPAYPVSGGLGFQDVWCLAPGASPIWAVFQKPLTSDEYLAVPTSPAIASTGFVGLEPTGPAASLVRHGLLFGVMTKEVLEKIANDMGLAPEGNKAQKQTWATAVVSAAFPELSEEAQLGVVSKIMG